MIISKISGADLKGMLRSGASWLYQHKDAVDALNVFPVPDGDTGSNMYMTFAAAVREADRLGDVSITKIASAAAMGALMGARGNSGVILSQFFRGMSKGLEGLETANASDVARACTEAAATAYKAVMRPVEGTILTVGREAAKGGTAVARTTDDVVQVLAAVVDEGNKALARTPEMLPALKDAGVVDAGGKGLLVAIEGALRYLRKVAEGVEFAESDASSAGTLPSSLSVVNNVVATEPEVARQGIVKAEDIEFMYCTEFLVKGNNLSADAIREHLTTAGDSLLVVGTSEIIKIHVHTNHPGKVLEYAVGLGTLSEIQINNMVEQNERAASEAPRVEPRKVTKPIGVVAVAMGDGITNIFKSLGVDVVIEGGQTMNPSIEEIKSAVEASGAESVVILPNNSNVILTAQQVSQLTDVPVAVIPTRTIPQGVNAMLALTEAESISEVASSMETAAKAVRTGEITFAVRNSRYNGLEIKEGNYIGLDDDEIVVTGDALDDVALSLLERMVSDDTGMITLFSGASVNSEQAELFASSVRDKFPDAEVELQRGGQPLYFYIIAVE